MEGPSDLELKRRQLKNQMSTVQTRKQNAVCVRRAFKKYGTKSSPYIILDGLNMTVPKGTIYGLLGSSGCGKTTLLNCIVGRKRLNAGEIWVLGGTPGSRGSGVPGPRIGYMPQEVALYGEFTIRETLKYFGWIAGMKNKAIEEKLSFLVEFLMMPDADRQVKNLSGGQQRRVSLAAALVHEPELLILDEPTVGVDPLLRANIWNHLVQITKNGSTTVIITTHYIDETRQAHLIGLLRGGYLLAEESPSRLITQFNAQSLEDVFLKLSVIQNMGKRRRSSIAQGVAETITVPTGVVNEAATIDDEVCEISGEFGDNISIASRGRRVSISPDTTDIITPMEIPPDEEPPVKCSEYLKILKTNHMKALIWKNYLWMWRNIPVMAFIIGLPVLQTILFCLTVGHKPLGLNVAVVNNEIDFPDEKCELTPGCNSTRLSCNYLHFLQNRSINLLYYGTTEEAIHTVEKGAAWATVEIPANFSESLRNRIIRGRSVDEWDLDGSTVLVYQDKSNENIGTFLQRDFYYSLQSFFEDFAISCNYDPKVGRVPIRYEKFIYGEDSPDFTNFAAPGVLLTIIFFLAVALTSGSILLERNEGILERSLVNGITGTELLCSHLITQFTVMVFQTILALFVAFGIFELDQNGNIFLVAFLTILTGFCGMFFGFVVACCCENERSATYMAMGSFLPIVMLCGIIWPIEGMYPILKIVSFVLPLTKSTESLRCILAKGWDLTSATVYEGFIATLIWIMIFLTISILALKFKKG
ncbi:hypothetical protein WA026_014776 [Henosepilachna vigintioctopunctata]|uniref:Uncharacterized protein n=1 Tax=Henosepilachna vigintioctopunctata TaxID=420089 RepID=A0AAW1UXX9_9CUCU